MNRLDALGRGPPGAVRQVPGDDAGVGQLSVKRFVAADLGASSVRVVVGSVADDTLEFAEVHRVPNVRVTVAGTLQWDVLYLYRAVVEGVRRAVLDGPPTSVGIDSWGVDYGLLDSDGRLLGNPVHHRDARTKGVEAVVLGRMAAAEIYAATGIQFSPINTLYQLVAAEGSAQLDVAERLLLIPDLLGYWLTGEIGAELTNASTTQLLDARTRQWSYGLIRALKLPERIFPPIRRTGEVVGAADAGALGAPLPVVAVGSHDTASAVAAVPATSDRFAYISCGTWSLIGVELDSPVLTGDGLDANFTNEIGVDGTVRYLRNVMGLWLLQESLRSWRAGGLDLHLADLLREAAALTSGAVIDAAHPGFLAPGDMPRRIVDVCRETGQTAPETPAETVRCVLDSLALAHRLAVRDAALRSGTTVVVVHIVGGGARSELLCQLTADACGLPVVAGPVEASAIGNILVQARTAGAVGDDLAALRRLVAATQPLRRYQPRDPGRLWDEAESRVSGG